MSDDFSPYGLNHVAQARHQLGRGEPCSHPGCLSHVSHPCEGCGRVGGTITLQEALAIEVENKRLADENARLREKAEVGEAVEGMPAGYALHHYDDASWLVRESNLSGWEKLPFPPTVTGAMKKAAEEYSYDPTWVAALRAAKGEETDHVH